MFSVFSTGTSRGLNFLKFSSRLGSAKNFSQTLTRFLFSTGFRSIIDPRSRMMDLWSRIARLRAAKGNAGSGVNPAFRCEMKNVRKCHEDWIHSSSPLGLLCWSCTSRRGTRSAHLSLSLSLLSLRKSRPLYASKREKERERGISIRRTDVLRNDVAKNDAAAARTGVVHAPVRSFVRPVFLLGRDTERRDRRRSSPIPLLTE